MKKSKDKIDWSEVKKKDEEASMRQIRVQDAPKEIRDFVRKKMNEPAPESILAKASATSESISSESRRVPRERTKFEYLPQNRFHFYCQRCGIYTNNFEMEYSDFDQSVEFFVSCHGEMYNIKRSKTYLIDCLKQYGSDFVQPLPVELSPIVITPEYSRQTRNLKVIKEIMRRYKCSFADAERSFQIFTAAGINAEDIFPEVTQKIKEVEEVKPITKILKRKIDL